MRIDATSSQNLLASLAGLNTRQSDIANELSSGVRLSRLSDDPVAVGQAAILADGIARNDAFVATANTAMNRLQAADTALGSVVTQITSAISAAVAGVSSDATGRAYAATQLTGIRQSLLSLSNSSYNGAYLFSGTSTAQPFVQAVDGSVSYGGNATGSELPLASGETVATSLPGSMLFTAPGGSVFGALNDLITNLTNNMVNSTNSATLVSALRDALSNVSSQRAVLNAAQNRVAGESSYASSQEANLKVEQNTLLAADTATLATDLSAVTTQRSALLSTLGLIEKGSLFDYLR